MNLSVKVVAEAGINHNGDFYTAKQLIDMALECGADAVKFQTWKPNRWDDLEQYRLSFRDHRELKQYAEAIGIEWFSTPFDLESVSYLEEIGMRIWKIPSGMITQSKYLKRISQCRGDKILSTGMATWDEIKQAVALLGRNNLTVLQCTTVYPTPYNEVNLKAMPRLRYFGKYGLSDHTQGIEVAIAAVALGASVIEKHFTLDRRMDGPDHAASAEPHEFRQMVDAVRHVEQAMGSQEKGPTEIELTVRDKIRGRMDDI